MRIVRIPSSRSNNMVVRLPHANMALDPRHIGYRRQNFKFSVKGRILTITRIDEDEGWDYGFCLRAYLPTETIPDFTSTVYTYWGLDNEGVPEGTTEVIFHPSVNTIIQMGAFYLCTSLLRVTIPDTVTRIEGDAFCNCNSLRFVRLPRNLEFIGDSVFYNCKSLEAVYLRPTLTHIGHEAFYNCKSLRSFHVSERIDHIGHDVFGGCDRLFAALDGNYNNDEVNQWLLQRYANLPFHQACSSTLVTPLTVADCYQEHGIELATEVDDEQMTALHILCLNPHATGDCIRVYLQLAPQAADQEDSEGMTPFQHLCNSEFTFVEDRSFSSLMIWWYHCMPPQTERARSEIVDDHG